MPGNHHDKHDGGDHDHPDDHGHVDGCGGSGDEDDGGGDGGDDDDDDDDGDDDDGCGVSGDEGG